MRFAMGTIVFFLGGIALELSEIPIWLNGCVCGTAIAFLIIDWIREKVK